MKRCQRSKKALKELHPFSTLFALLARLGSRYQFVTRHAARCVFEAAESWVRQL